MPVSEPGTCPACSGTGLAQDLLREHGIPLARCVSCGLRWLAHPPSGAELERLYGSGFYEPTPPRAALLLDQLHRIDNQVRLRHLRGLVPGRLLDVGSGKGRFIHAARAAGWDVVGVENAPASANHARAAAGAGGRFDVVVGDFVGVPLEGSFDVVTMWHVLEHLPEPGAALDRAADVIRRGGRLVVSVPNAASLQARLGGEDWFHLDVPRHLFHFTPRSITAIVEAAGFRVRRIGYWHPEMEVIGLVQTALNRIGIENDLLYRFAKRDPTARAGTSLTASVAIAAALAPGAAAWAVVASALRTGASMQVVAEPR